MHVDIRNFFNGRWWHLLPFGGKSRFFISLPVGSSMIYIDTGRRR